MRFVSCGPFGTLHADIHCTYVYRCAFGTPYVPHVTKLLRILSVSRFLRKNETTTTQLASSSTHMVYYRDKGGIIEAIESSSSINKIATSFLCQQWISSLQLPVVMATVNSIFLDNSNVGKEFHKALKILMSVQLFQGCTSEATCTGKPELQLNWLRPLLARLWDLSGGFNVVEFIFNESTDAGIFFFPNVASSDYSVCINFHISAAVSTDTGICNKINQTWPPSYYGRDTGDDQCTMGWPLIRLLPLI